MFKLIKTGGCCIPLSDYRIWNVFRNPTLDDKPVYSWVSQKRLNANLRRGFTHTFAYDLCRTAGEVTILSPKYRKRIENQWCPVIEFCINLSWWFYAGRQIKFFLSTKGTEFFSRFLAKIILSPNRKPKKNKIRPLSAVSLLITTPVLNRTLLIENNYSVFGIRKSKSCSSMVLCPLNWL